jgi:CheY-like chemotaxis protein/predicted regulator of Ras-like GTPase activity (Roadblock/LC7/MglB family)
MPKVLVIDDSVSVRKVVERALAGRQIDVVTAASGAEGIERLEKEHPDIVVCDVVMPDRDGYEICEFVKAHASLGRTPVLLMSGIVNDEVRDKAAQVRCDGVLAKPFAGEDLVRHLEALLPSRLTVTAAATPPPPIAAAPVAPRIDRAVPAAVPAPTVVTSASEPVEVAGTARSILAAIGAMEGVQWAVLADREGFLLEATAEAGVDAEVAGALSACLAESSDGLGRELGRGGLQGMILEYEKGMVVLHGVGVSALLAIGLSEPSALGKVRYYAKKAIAELARVM